MNIETLATRSLAALSDDELINEQRELAAARRTIDARSAEVAAEIAHRSRPELGYEGLAQRRGARSADTLVQQVTGLSRPDARTLVRVGTLLAQHSPASPLAPEQRWLASCAAAVAEGSLSVEAAEVIRAGLGTPDDAVPLNALAAAARRLVTAASELTLERLAALARRYRDDLDEAGIADRESQRRDRRFLSLTPQADGMTRISGLLDPESAAIIVGAVDAATSPRRGGPRFVDPADGPALPADDDRTIPQLTADVLVDLVRIATRADDGTLLGSHPVGVRVLVSQRDLERGVGRAEIEGQRDAVTVQTARRHLCDSGAVSVRFDASGIPLDVGRAKRLFTPRQRIALAARDGGCLFPDCDRPPSWTEAHHIIPWRDGGKTNIADGVLLCRHHHLLVHNNGWRITRTGGNYDLYPPPRPDRAIAPIRLTPKSSMVGRMLRRA
jgi:hypothetical protein